MWYAFCGLALWAAASVGFFLGSCWTAFIADRLERLAKETYTRGRVAEIAYRAENEQRRRPVP